MGFQDGGGAGGPNSHIIPEPNWKYIKLGNKHPELPTKDYLKRRLKSKERKKEVTMKPLQTGWASIDSISQGIT